MSACAVCRNLVFALTLIFSLSIWGLLSVPCARAKGRGDPAYFQKLTGDDFDSEKSRWDAVYRKHHGYVFGREPAAFLQDNIGLLPVGRALDIAMGEGRNAVFLAKKGFEVTGVDISDVAVRKARKLAAEGKVKIRAITADLKAYKIAPESYDVIMVFYYLQPSLIPEIIRGLKPGGMVVFENYLAGQVKYNHSIERKHLLAPGELKSYFKELEVVKYQETDTEKDGAVASIIARKPQARKGK